MADRAICSVEGCDKPVHARDLCSKHYQRLKRHGDASRTHRYEGASCTIEGCERTARAYGLCATHDMRKRRHGDPMARPAVRRFGCLVEGCARKHAVRGYCKLHYDRFLRLGSPRGDTPARIAPGTRMRWLLAHANHPGEDCLIWPFSRDHNGYARITVDGVQSCASRAMCEIANGAPETYTLQAAHNCGQGHLGCVNPRHLRWDTVAGNHADKAIHGTEIKGTDQWQAKLTDADVRSIRAAKGTVSQQRLADRYGVNQTTISKIQRRVSWVWLD